MTPTPVTEWKNLFGICAALGDEFGIDPLWPRLAFGASLILAPVIVIASYFALGAILLLSRLALPNRPALAPPAPALAPRPREAVPAPLPLAA